MSHDMWGSQPISAGDSNRLFSRRPSRSQIAFVHGWIARIRECHLQGGQLLWPCCYMYVKESSPVGLGFCLRGRFHPVCWFQECQIWMETWVGKSQDLDARTTPVTSFCFAGMKCTGPTRMDVFDNETNALIPPCFLIGFLFVIKVPYFVSFSPAVGNKKFDTFLDSAVLHSFSEVEADIYMASLSKQVNSEYVLFFADMQTYCNACLLEASRCWKALDACIGYRIRSFLFGSTWQ